MGNDGSGPVISGRNVGELAWSTLGPPGGNMYYGRRGVRTYRPRFELKALTADGTFFSVVQVVPNTFAVLIVGRLLTYVESFGFLCVIYS